MFYEKHAFQYIERVPSAGSPWHSSVYRPLLYPPSPLCSFHENLPFISYTILQFFCCCSKIFKGLMFSKCKTWQEAIPRLLGTLSWGLRFSGWRKPGSPLLTSPFTGSHPGTVSGNRALLVISTALNLAAARSSLIGGELPILLNPHQGLSPSLCLSLFCAVTKCGCLVVLYSVVSWGMFLFEVLLYLRA